MRKLARRRPPSILRSTSSACGRSADSGHDLDLLAPDPGGREQEIDVGKRVHQLHGQAAADPGARRLPRARVHQHHVRAHPHHRVDHLAGHIGGPEHGARAPHLLGDPRRSQCPAVFAHLAVDDRGDQAEAPQVPRQPGAAPDQAAVRIVAQQQDQHVLTRLHHAAALRHRVGDQPQPDLTQRGQVGLAEEVAEGGLDALGRVDVAVPHPLAQGLRRDVDELEVAGLVEQPVRDGLPDRDPGDPLDEILHSLDVLDVDRCEHVDPRVEQHLNVLPALLIPHARHVGVRQLVDQRHLRVPA